MPHGGSVALKGDSQELLVEDSQVERLRSITVIKEGEIEGINTALLRAGHSAVDGSSDLAKLDPGFLFGGIALNPGPTHVTHFGVV